MKRKKMALLKMRYGDDWRAAMLEDAEYGGSVNEIHGSSNTIHV